MAQAKCLSSPKLNILNGEIRPPIIYSVIDVAKNIEYLFINPIDENIESIIDELNKRRNMRLGEYNSCVIKVTTKGIECYIPDINYVHYFHISQCSEGEYLEYKNGELKSENYHYFLGKCIVLNLEKMNLNSGKLQFILKEEIENKHLL